MVGMIGGNSVEAASCHAASKYLMPNKPPCRTSHSGLLVNMSSCGTKPATWSLLRARSA